MFRPLIIIPARMQSTRLPGKPLADIGGKPMIARVVECAKSANIAPVIVAVAEAEVAQAAEGLAAATIMTDPDLPSGTDRVHQALERFDPKGEYNYIINVQGDLPFLPPEMVIALAKAMETHQPDMATLACPIAEAGASSVVKLVMDSSGHALYFSRAAIPHGASSYLKHIGLYGYRRDILSRFVSLPVSPLEECEKLEQLRALEAGIRIHVSLVDGEPMSVDTPEDLAKARTHITQRL